MRDAVFWLSGAALAFLITAGAFLLLANLATLPSERSLAPDPPSKGSGATMDLALDPERLASLKPLPDQGLYLAVKNEGTGQLSNVNATLIVSSENTALSGSRYYRQTIDKVAAGGTAYVFFEFDLSTPKQAAGQNTTEPARNILEFRATTPEGISTVRTVILPP